jgi:uncharacterized repeat protein (TIGR02543 family)
MTIFAMWRTTRSVVFHANNGKNENPVVQVYSIDENQTIGELPAEPARDGYTFAGWFLPVAYEPYEIPITANTPVLSQMTVYAKWEVDITYVPLDDSTVQVGDGDSAAIHPSITGRIQIPVTVTISNKTYTVTSIGSFAFANTGIVSVSIPDTVTSIGSDAFNSCRSLETVIFGRNSQLHTIGESAFRGCSALTSIDIPNVRIIEEFTFADCESLRDVTLSNQLTHIERNAFIFTNIRALDLPEGLTSIGGRAFLGCQNLLRIDIPDTVTSIGEMAFANTRLEYVILPNQVTHIDRSLFAGSPNLETIIVPDSVETIERGAFEGTKWYHNQADNKVIYAGKVAYGFKGEVPDDGEIRLKLGTRSIVNYAFEGINLSSIIIPNSVTHIGEDAFSGLENDGLEIYVHAGSPAETILLDREIPFLYYPPADSGDSGMQSFSAAFSSSDAQRYNAALGGRAFTDAPGPNPPENALTASTNSRFESLHGPRNLEITFTADLGQYYDIDEIKILFASQASSATKFKLETSNRLHGPYIEVYNVQNREPNRDFATTELYGNTEGVRYVRLTAFEKPGTFGYSFNLFEVYGVPSAIETDFTGDILDPTPEDPFTNVALNKTATSEQARNDPQLGISANQLTRFESVHNRENYEMVYEIDLHDVYSIERIKILWDNENTTATKFKIEVATDKNGDWTEVVNVRGGNPVWRFDRYFTPVDAKYVRLTAYEKTGPWGYSFRTFEVLGRG